MDQEVDECAHLRLGKTTRRVDCINALSFNRKIRDRDLNKTLVHCIRIKKARQVCDAKTTNTGVEQRLPVVHSQPASGTHLALFARRRSKFPYGRVGLIRIMQQLMFVQIVDLLGTAILFKVSRARDHALCRLCQLSGPQCAVFQLTDANSHVEPFRNQFNVTVVEDHVHRDVREFSQKAAKDRRQVIDAKVRCHGNPQQARRC